jgi:hypothetical protein
MSSSSNIDTRALTRRQQEINDLHKKMENIANKANAVGNLPLDHERHKQTYTKMMDEMAVLGESFLKYSGYQSALGCVVKYHDGLEDDAKKRGIEGKELDNITGNVRALEECIRRYQPALAGDHFPFVLQVHFGKELTSQNVWGLGAYWQFADSGKVEGYLGANITVSDEVVRFVADIFGHYFFLDEIKFLGLGSGFKVYLESNPDTEGLEGGFGLNPEVVLGSFGIGHQIFQLAYMWEVLSYNSSIKGSTGLQGISLKVINGDGGFPKSDLSLGADIILNPDDSIIAIGLRKEIKDHWIRRISFMPALNNMDSAGLYSRVDLDLIPDLKVLGRFGAYAMILQNTQSGMNELDKTYATFPKPELEAHVGFILPAGDGSTPLEGALTFSMKADGDGININPGVMLQVDPGRILGRPDFIINTGMIFSEHNGELDIHVPLEILNRETLNIFGEDREVDFFKHINFASGALLYRGSMGPVFGVGFTALRILHGNKSLQIIHPEIRQSLLLNPETNQLSSYTNPRLGIFDFRNKFGNGEEFYFDTGIDWLISSPDDQGNTINHLKRDEKYPFGFYLGVGGAFNLNSLFE